MKKSIFETLIGALVLAIAVGFSMFAYKIAELRSQNSGYIIKAKFDQADGIEVGSDVSVAGVKIGTVTKELLDPTSFAAIIEMNIDKDIKLPDDSSAQIVSSGLIGGKYVKIVPGGNEKFLAAGGIIEYTQSSVNLETLIGKMIFNSENNSSK